MKKILLTTIILIGIIFYGCGGGGSSSSSTTTSDTTTDTTINDDTSQAVFTEDPPSDTELASLSETILSESVEDVDEATRNEFDEYVNNYNLESRTSSTKSDFEQDYIIEPKSRADLYRMLSIYALIERSVSGALWSSSVAVSLDATDPVVLAHMGAVLNQNERYEEAKLYLLKSIELDFNSATAHMSLSISYEALGDIDKAVYEASIALSLYPTNPAIIESFSILYENLGQTAVAQSILELLEIYTSEIPEEIVIPDINSLEILDNVTIDLSLFTNLPEGENQEFVTKYIQCTQLHLDRIDEISTSYSDTWDYYLNIFDTEVEEHNIFLEGCFNGCSEDYGCPCGCVQGQLGLDVDSFEDLMNNIANLNPQYQRDMMDAILPYQSCAYETYYEYSESLSQEEQTWADSLAELTVDVHYSSLAGIYNENVRLVDGLVYSMGSRIVSTQLICGPSSIESGEDDEEDTSTQDAEDRVIQAADSAKNNPPEVKNGEVCFLFVCIGKSNGSYSFKVNAVFASAKFSVDVSKMELGIDVGLGLSDPTGNLGGISYEITSTINSSLQTSIGIKGSGTALFGSKEIIFFERRQRSGY